MITAKMRSILSNDLLFSQDDIREMTPRFATELIKTSRKKDPHVTSDDMMYWREHFSKHDNLPKQSTTEASEIDDCNPYQISHDTEDCAAEKEESDDPKRQSSDSMNNASTDSAPDRVFEPLRRTKRFHGKFDRTKLD